MKVSTRQKQGATRHSRAGAKGDNSASWASGSLGFPLVRTLGLYQVPDFRHGARLQMRVL